MSSDLRFQAEYSPSSRATCRGCRNKIDKDTLRLAAMVQSTRFDGLQPNWYHLDCFFQKQRVSTVAEIADFDSLRWEDQQKIREKMGGAGPSGSQSASNNLSDFATEYAKSSRSTCHGCDNKIEKDAIRICKFDYESEEARMYGRLPRWYHLDCFVKARQELEYFASADKLPGFLTLGVDHQNELKRKLNSTKKFGV